MGNFINQKTTNMEDIQFDLTAAKGWLIVVDCDGVLTDGSKHAGISGTYKGSNDNIVLQRSHMSFHSRDSIACQLLTQNGARVVVVTISPCPIIPDYWVKYGAQVFQCSNPLDKRERLQEFIERIGQDPQKTIGVGDDITDLFFLSLCNLKFVPQDGAFSLIQKIGGEEGENIVRPGGTGVLAEVMEIFLNQGLDKP